MDEPKGTTENTTPKEGHAYSSEGGTPQEPLTHTKTQVDEALQKDRIVRGRDDKALQTREDVVAAREAEADRRQGERYAEELATAQGDPVALDALQLKKEKADLARSKAEHQSEIESARETKREISVWEIATKYGVDAETLKALDLDAVKTEVVAKAMAGGEPATDKEGKKIEKPDSGVTIGGKGIDAMSADEKIRYGIEHPKK